MNLPDPSQLTVAQLEAEIKALMLRADQAALTDPLSLAAHLDDRVVRRPHLEVISSTIAQLTPGGGDRVMIICPPQVGKTWLACWSVLWWLIQHPEHRVIIGSYGTTLAADRGRTIRRLVETFGDKYGLELMKGAKSVTNWSLTSGGGCRSAGVGAGITGMPADCVAEGTRILTPSGYLPVEHVAVLASPFVLSYNHQSRRAEWRQVQASRRIEHRDILEVVTRSGRALRCTADHRVYTAERGYVPAQDLRVGDRLITSQGASHAPIPDHPSHQRGRRGQPAREPDHFLPPLPQEAPCVGDDTVAVVRGVRGERVAVYDLQVEGNSNFFAEEVLVHNCFLIDDPIRSRADAESRIVREQLWDWWSGDVNSRLAPGAPVVLVNTRWHPEDLSGRLIAEEGTTHEGGRWRIVYLPAFAVPADADRGIPPDSLGRTPGQPLTHPKIDVDDRARLAAHWEDKRNSATPRDWAALWQGDPRPVEGALVTRSLLRERHDYRPTATPIKHAIAVDPAAEGRDSVGIVAGWLGDDLRLYVSQDASMAGGVSVEKWTRRVVTLAHQIDADTIVYEQNYGKAMIRRVITAAWEDAQRTGDILRDAVMPLLVPEKAKKGKYLRAEPVAQLLTVDKIRLAAPMPELESEWCTWVPTDPMSPGRLDAMVYLAYRLLRPRRSRGTGGRSGLNPGAVSRSAVLAQSGSGLTIPAPRRAADRFTLRQTLRDSTPR